MEYRSSREAFQSLNALAKFLGVLIVILLFGFSSSLTTIMTVQMTDENLTIDWWAGIPLLLAPIAAYFLAAIMNCATRRSFPSNAFMLLVFMLLGAFLLSGLFDHKGHITSFGSVYSWNLVPACSIITMAITVLSSLAASLEHLTIEMPL
ncbi:MAG: hypothetical protein GKR87_16410 [Kiritimatiellae bacterium]|nr:hypothetical protein [Kiritimatiellia bacterium]